MQRETIPRTNAMTIRTLGSADGVFGAVNALSSTSGALGNGGGVTAVLLANAGVVGNEKKNRLFRRILSSNYVVMSSLWPSLKASVLFWLGVALLCCAGIFGAWGW